MMDKKKVIELAKQVNARVYEVAFKAERKLIDVVFAPEELHQFAAAILLEAVKACDEMAAELTEKDDFIRMLGADDCAQKLDQIAKELTQ
jgi:hypothetical protein